MVIGATFAAAKPKRVDRMKAAALNPVRAARRLGQPASSASSGDPPSYGFEMKGDTRLPFPQLALRPFHIAEGMASWSVPRLRRAGRPQLFQARGGRGRQPATPPPRDASLARGVGRRSLIGRDEAHYSVRERTKSRFEATKASSAIPAAQGRRLRKGGQLAVRLVDEAACRARVPRPNG